MHIHSRALCAMAFLAAFVPSLTVAQLEPKAAQQVSVGIGSSVPDATSSNPMAAPNADIIVFQSASSNLVRGDTNQQTDVFQRAPSGAVTRLSISETGEEANDLSEKPAISQVEPDGTYAVAFVSRATNLVPIAGSPEVRYKQIYVRIPSTGKTILVTRGLQGGYGDADSIDPTVVSLEAGSKYMVAFVSKASNLSDDGGIGNPANPTFQLMVAFVNATGSVTKIRSIRGPNGVIPNGDMLSPKFSGNGQKIVFVTSASNLGWSNPQAIRQVVLGNKTLSSLSLLSTSSTGEPGTQPSELPAINYDGTKVVFRTVANNIFDSSASDPTYVLYTEGESGLAVANTDSDGKRQKSSIMPWITIDPSGRFVAFHSGSSTLVSGDTNGVDDVFVKDLQTGSVVIAARNSADQQPNGASNECSLGGFGFNGTQLNLSYFSQALNLGPLTATGHGQVFRTKLEFPPPPLAPNVEIQNPPDVKARSTQLIITLQKFSGVSSSSVQAFWRGEGEVDMLANRITYDVRLTRSSTKKVQKTTSSRNRVAFRNLAPGKYTVKYRASSTSSSGKTINSKFSPARSVTVRKS